MGDRVQAHKSDGVGIKFPERKADCSGERPAWFPFQMNVCDTDEPALDALPTDRHRRIPAAPEPPAWLEELM